MTAYAREMIEAPPILPETEGRLCDSCQKIKTRFRKPTSRICTDCKRVRDNSRMYARKRKSVGSYSARQLEDLKHKYDYQCVACGVSENDAPLTADHVVPVSKGGTGYIDNIQPLCKQCNGRKADMWIDYRPDSEYFIYNHGAWINTLRVDVMRDLARQAIDFMFPV